jgi:hypothetical protein
LHQIDTSEQNANKALEALKPNEDGTYDAKDMLKLQEQFANKQLMITTMSNIMKGEQDTKKGIAANLK